MSGDGGAGIVGINVIGSVCSASSVGSVSTIISGVGSALVAFFGSISASIVWFGSRFSSLWRIYDWLFRGSSILVSSSCVSSRGASETSGFASVRGF